MTIIETGNRVLLFIHIPKTAGTSICKAFGVFTRGHASIKKFPANIRHHYFKFCFVRNPYDRLVSSYFYLKANGSNHIDKADNERFLISHDTFKDFIINGLGKNPKFYFEQQHLKPQYSFITNENDKIEIDFIGRYENLDNDFEKLLEKINYGRQIKLTNEKKGDHKFYNAYYDIQMADIVYQVYKRDFLSFGYNP